MKAPFIRKIANLFKGKEKAKPVTEIVLPFTEKRSPLEHFIPKKTYHRPPIMATELASIYRKKRNVRNRMQKHSRKVNFGLA